MCWDSLSVCNLCVLKLKCFLGKWMTVGVKQRHKLPSLVSYFQSVRLSLCICLVLKMSHWAFLGAVWFPDSLTRGSDSLASCAATMSLINRNPQRKRAVFRLPGHYGSLCSITLPRKQCGSDCCREINNTFLRMLSKWQNLNSSRQEDSFVGTCCIVHNNNSCRFTLCVFERTQHMLISSQEAIWGSKNREVDCNLTFFAPKRHLTINRVCPSVC